MGNSRYKPEIGQRFGEGTVIDNEVWVYRPNGTRAHGAQLACDCGQLYSAIWNTLKPDGGILSCGCRYAQTRQAGGLNRRKTAPPGLKACTGCDGFHDPADFGADSRASDGLQSISRACLVLLLQKTGRGAMHNNARRARKFAARITGPVPASTYAAIIASGPCIYCGAPATTADHVTPLARGGHEAEYNLVPACRPCNSSKAAKLLTEWDQAKLARAVACSWKVIAQLAHQAQIHH